MGAIALIVDAPYFSSLAGEEVYKISVSQMRRVREHFCGVKECRCPAGGVLESDWDRYGKAIAWEIRSSWCVES